MSSETQGSQLRLRLWVLGAQLSLDGAVFCATGRQKQPGGPGQGRLLATVTSMSGSQYRGPSGLCLHCRSFLGGRVGRAASVTCD